MESRSVASSYLVPYQDTPKEPTLVMPMMPDLGPPPEPLPQKRPPPPGYDMKTLRRQVDYLQDEINSRVDNYNSICNQNEKLFAYVQELVKANDFNVNNMRDYCRKVHEELRHVKRERAQLVEKLEFMVNSKRLLTDLGKELEEAQISSEEMARRKQEAEQALRQAIEERNHIEHELDGKVEQMKDYEVLLDRYKEQSRELQALETAEEFFFTNRTVLKAAYHRFRLGVTKRMRCTKLHELFTRFYRLHLKIECWQLWKGFLKRKMIMKRNRLRRQRENLHLSLARWKVQTAYEVLFARSRRLRLLQIGFAVFLRHHQERKYEIWAEDVTQDWKNHVKTRSIFQSWKQQTCFLDWYSPTILAQETIARQYYLRRTLHAWRVASHENRFSLYHRSLQVTQRYLHKRFCAWRWLCLRQWKYRGRLLRRFIVVSRQRLSTRAYYDGLSRKANVFHWQFHKLRLFRQWRKYTVKRLQVMIPVDSKVEKALTPSNSVHKSTNNDYFDDHDDTRSNNSNNHAQPLTKDDLFTPHATSSKSTHNGKQLRTAEEAAEEESRVQNLKRLQQTATLTNHYQHRLLTQHFKAFHLSILSLRQQHFSMQLARQHYRTRRCTKQYGLWQWRAFVQQRQTLRHYYHLLSRRRALLQWKQTVQRQQYTRFLKEGIARLQALQLFNRNKHTWQLWSTFTQKVKRLRLTETHCVALQQYHRLQKIWQRWHNRYVSRLVWKLKELDIDMRRIQALQALQAEHISSKQQECQLLQHNTASLAEELSLTKQALLEKEHLAKQQEEDLMAQQEMKLKLEQDIALLQQQLQETEAEKQRWTALEASLAQQRVLESSERAKKYAEVTQRIQLLQDEQAFLQNSLQNPVKTAQTHARELTELQLQEQLHAYQEEEQLVQALSAQVATDSQVVAQLTEEQETLLQAVSSVTHKLQDIVQEAEVYGAENDKRLREQQAEVEVLKADSGVAQARVSALLEMVEEASQQQGRMHMEEIQSNELRETMEMQRLRASFQEKMDHLEHHYIHSRLHAVPVFTQNNNNNNSNIHNNTPLHTSFHSNNQNHNETSMNHNNSSRLLAEQQLQKVAQLHERLSHPQWHQPSPPMNTSHVHTNGSANNSVARSVNSGSVPVPPPIHTNVPVQTNPIVPVVPASPLSTASAASFSYPPRPTPHGGANNTSATSTNGLLSPLLDDAKRLDRQYADAREAIRSLTSRLTRPLPMDHHSH